MDETRRASRILAVAPSTLARYYNTRLLNVILCAQRAKARANVL